MRTRKNRFSVDRSGQLLIVAALAIAILISSTTAYVYELSKESGNPQNQSIGDLALALKQSTRNAIISSLANASNGEEEDILTTNLGILAQVFRSLHQLDMCSLAFTPFGDAPYDSGTWLSWNTTGADVSSACANFVLDIRDGSDRAMISYAVNITTSLTMDGVYQLQDSEKHVNLTCRIYNEGLPALAESLNVFYLASGNWTEVDASGLSEADHGNGTYVLTFPVPQEATQISIHMRDLRNILVQSKYDIP
jgi:hypothetical protein